MPNRGQSRSVSGQQVPSTLHQTKPNRASNRASRHLHLDISWCRPDFYYNTIKKEGCTKPARPGHIQLHFRILKEGGISKKSARFSEEILAHCCRGWRWTVDPGTVCPVMRPALPIVTLRGSARGSILENLPQQGEIMPSISKIFPLCVPKAQNPPKISPQTLPKPSQNLRKASQNPSRSPPGAHFGQMLERSSILNVQKAATRRPKAPKGGPRRPQTPPK